MQYHINDVITMFIQCTIKTKEKIVNKISFCQKYCSSVAKVCQVLVIMDLNLQELDL